MITYQLPPYLQCLYPFSLHYAYPNGLQYHYLDEGDGELVIMLHGNPTWSFYYRKLILALRDNYHIIVPDHIGMGLSEKPQKYNYRLENHINNLEFLLREKLKLKDKITLIMHDWGGAIGMGYAMRYPEQIKKLIILNTAAFPNTKIPLRLEICRIPKLNDFLVRRLNGFVLAALYETVVKPLPTDVKKGYMFPYNNYNNRISILRFVEDIPMNKSAYSYNLLVEIEKHLVDFHNHPVLIQSPEYIFQYSLAVGNCK